MTPTTCVWSWSEFTQAFGTGGAIVLVCLAILSLCSWLATPLWLFFLSAKTRLLTTQVESLHEQIAALQRSQQVQRLRQDSPPRRKR